MPMARFTRMLAPLCYPLCSGTGLVLHRNVRADTKQLQSLVKTRPHIHLSTSSQGSSEKVISDIKRNSYVISQFWQERISCDHVDRGHIVSPPLASA